MAGLAGRSGDGSGSRLAGRAPATSGRRAASLQERRTGAGSPVRPPRGGRAGRALGRLGDYAFLLPALVLVAALLLASALFTVYLSFTSWNLLGTPEFVGLANYLKVVKDPTALKSLSNTLIWVVGGMLLPVLGGLLVAVFIDSVPLQALWKAIIYLPVVIAPTITGVVWKQIYNLDGPLNAGLLHTGLTGTPVAWLNETPLNTYVMVVTSTWRTLGPAMVLFLVGLQTIPRETVEASLVDGAGAFRAFLSIKLPQIRPIFVVVVTLAIVNSFSTYDFVYVMTGGGPYQSSETLALTIYRLGFAEFRVGYSAALAVILGAITLVFSVVYIWRGIERSPRARRTR